MKKIIVTEKKSVGQTYADVLGVTEEEDGYYENEEYIITWCIGHLVTLAYPEDYDESLKKWNLDTLPFLPEKYKYVVIKNVADQFRVIKKLYNRDDIDTIYYAGDAAREGIYIQALVREKAGHNKNAKELVVWIDSQTEEEIQRGLREAEPYSSPKYQNLIASGYARGIEDYSSGINFSRILSLQYAPMLNMAAGITDYVPISVGRVMTCVLGMVVVREREILGFKPTPFFKIKNTLVIDGNEIEGNWKVTEGSAYFDSPKLYDESGFKIKDDAMELIDSLPRSVLIEKIDRTVERKGAPVLFNLAELQAECTKQFKISPDTTLAIAQVLYERKMTTYPRTDARVLSTAVAKEIRTNISGLCDFESVSDFAERIIDNQWDIKLVQEKSTRYIDDSKITDHYAIIPTGKELDQFDSLRDIEKKVFLLIVRRFLAIFFPKAEYDKVSVIEKAGNEYFLAGAKVLRSAGYLEVLGKGEDCDGQEGTELFDYLQEGQEYPTKYEIKKGETAPPKRYTSGNMVLAMENAGKLIEEEELREHIKGSGIGTSATRAETIKKLVRLGYLDQNEKTQILTPSCLGNMVYEVIASTVPALLNPKMTASWEKGLDSIRTGELGASEYMGKLEAYVRSECENMKQNDKRQEIARRIKPYAKTTGYENAGGPFVSHALSIPCPDCGGVINTAPFGFACENYKKENGTCGFAIGRVAGVSLTDAQVTSLIQQGRTEVIKGFQSKNKQTFAAALVLEKDEDGKSKIGFDFSVVRPDILQGARCPICRSNIYITKFGYGCASYKKDDPDSCKFFIGKIAGKMLTSEQAKTLIMKRSLGPIKGFTAKNGNKFAAPLKIGEDGKVSFDFKEEVLEESKYVCPKCGNSLMKGNIYFKHADNVCEYKLPHTVATKKLTEKQIDTLMKQERTEKIRGFKSKKGKLFDAVLVADCNGKVEFIFDK